MASVAAEERKGHVQELRKAHFQFGFVQGTNYTSSQKDPLPVQKNAKVRPMSTMVQNQQSQPQLTQFDIKQQLQKNHHQFGDREVPNVYETIHQTSYQRPQTALERATLSKETKEDLRKHHFQLGFHQVDKPSEYKQNFTQTQNEPKNNQSGSNPTETLRKHNHDFGDKNTYYSTMYDQMHNQQYNPQLLGQGKTKQQMMNQITELRKTNLVMGRDQVDYTTQSHAIHKSQPIQNNFVNNQDIKNLVKNTHIEVGTDEPQYVSEAKGRFTGNQPISRIKLDESTKKDLRATHFTYGNDPLTFDTTAKVYYKEPSQGVGGQAVKNPETQQTHFKLEDVGNQLKVDEHYKSSYNNNFVASTKKTNQATQIRNDKQDRSSNIVFGSDKVSDRFTSEAANNYLDHKAPPSKLQEDVQKDLKSHHYKFGEDQPTLQSQTKFSHQPMIGKPAKLEDHLKKDLRSHHFQFGYNKPDWITHHQEIGSKQGPPNKLDPEVARKIKAHSIQQN